MLDLPISNKQQPQVAPRSWPKLGLIFTLIVIAILVPGIICHVSSTSCGSYNKAFLILLPIAYLAYLIECCCSHSHRYLMNNMNLNELEGFMKKIKAAAPRIGRKFECYHEEQQKRTVRTKDSNGNDISYEETYKQKVVTYTGTTYFHYDRFEDTTGDVVELMEEGLIKLEVEKTYVFGSEESRTKFLKQERDCISIHKKKDQKLNDWPVFEIPGYEPRMLVQNKGGKKLCGLGLGWYWIFTLFLLSWPYRMWFEKISKTRKIMLTKVIYLEEDKQLLVDGENMNEELQK